MKNPLFCGIIEEEKSFRIYNSVTFRGGIFCCGNRILYAIMRIGMSAVLFISKNLLALF